MAGSLSRVCSSLYSLASYHLGSMRISWERGGDDERNVLQYGKKFNISLTYRLKSNNLNTGLSKKMDGI